jgi:3-oxoacyl-[acyl-carrier protein] reductase
VAIVTGAAHGIGRAIAERYGAEGATIVVCDVDAAGADTVAQEIVAAGGTAVAVTADVSAAASVDRLFAETLERFGTIDVLVNNAGLTATERHFLEGDEAWWDKIHAVNLKGAFLCGLRAAKHMAGRGEGVIINLSSGGATRAHRGNAAYDATKGGIEALTRAMAVDLAPYGIRVNGLIPGAIDTRGMDEQTRRERGQAIPMGRMGEPAELAGPAVFLASDDAAYVTGHLLAVDGGILAAMRSPQADIFPPARFPKLEQS